MRVIAYAVAAALMFAGCTEPEPKEPKASSTPTVTAPTIPPMPSQAREQSPEGAAAFVSHYINLFNYAAATGESAPLLAVSSNCEACTKYALDFEKVYDRGDHISETLWTLKTRNLKVVDNSINVLTTIETTEHGKQRTYRVVFVLPTEPPYKVSEIYEAEPQ